jgi:ABC-type nitrate/sulfonate/bicarbonate transport system permease component
MHVRDALPENIFAQRHGCSVGGSAALPSATVIDSFRRRKPLRSALEFLSRMKESTAFTTFAKGIAGVVAFVALWEAVRALGLIDARDLPPFGAVLNAAAHGLAGGELSLAILATILSWAPGLLIAAVIGIVAGIALALLPALERVTRPLLEFLRPIPSVALIPVALLTLGIGIEMQLAMISFASVWPILFGTKAGVESVDPRYRETGRVFGLGSAEQIRRIVLPSALPSIATGLRTASAIALALAITVEMLTGRPGIGFYIQNVRLNGLVTEMWAAIFVTGVLGYLVNAVLLALERSLLPWSPENRDP